MEARCLAQKLHCFETRRFELLYEAFMWKITTHGFTLQEVLILAAMNIATAVIAAEKRGLGASQNDTKGPLVKDMMRELIAKGSGMPAIEFQFI
jgi:hypothetical protein